MKITIEKRKAKGCKENLRLVYYYGYTKGDDGKITHHRKRETLDLFLYEKPRSAIEQRHNKDTQKLAEAIRAKRIVEAESSKHGFRDNTKSKANFFDYFEKLCDDKAKTVSRSSHAIWISALKHLRSYHGQNNLPVELINEDFVKRFKEYLLTQSLTKSLSKLSQNTASIYFNKIRAALKQAHKDGLLLDNPAQTVSPIKERQNKREYLTIDELKSLAQTNCRYDFLKRAFLFSCLTGVRWSDINKLKWDDVQEFDGGYRIVFHQEKTDGLQYLDISQQAYDLMGEKVTDRVFYRLKYSAYMNTELLRWCLAAGISKHITFHSGRHTFAVAQLTLGTDIYTVSKLLGHSEIKTTQIYADIIDQHRKQAMHKMPDIGL